MLMLQNEIVERIDDGGQGFGGVVSPETRETPAAASSLGRVHNTPK
jgi:hypothetical protein